MQEIIHFILAALCIFFILFFWKGGAIVIGRYSNKFFFRWNQNSLETAVKDFINETKKQLNENELH